MRLKKSGVTLVVGMLMVTVLVTLTSAMVILGSGNLAGSFQQVQTDQAVCAAEAGGWRAALELSKNSNWTPPGGNITLPHTGSQFGVQLFTAGSTTPNGVVVPAGLIYVLSTGATPSGRTKQVGMMIKTGVGALNYAALTGWGITVSGGSELDSRDPATDLVLPDPASIAVNSPMPAIPIMVSGGSHIQGSAYVGPGASTSQIQVIGGSSISGAQGALSAAIPMPPVTLPSDPSLLPPGGATSGATVNYTPGTFGHIVVDGGATLNLAAGTYVFKALEVTGGGKLAISGPVEIFIQSGLTVNVGSLLNPTKDPKNMKFNVGNGIVDITSGGTSYGVFYAPNSPINLDGNGTIYGNLVGLSLNVDHGSHLHYDPNSSGSGVGGGATTAQVISQQTL